MSNPSQYKSFTEAYCDETHFGKVLSLSSRCETGPDPQYPGYYMKELPPVPPPNPARLHAATLRR